MTDNNAFEINDGVLVGYHGGEEAVIPQGVSRIGAYAFIGNDIITKVTIPQGVTHIEQQAFRGCEFLKEVVLPQGVQVIERFAFCGCGQLEDITIPDSVTEIGNSAFRGCDLISDITLPKGLVRLGESAFSDCGSLKSAEIPGSLGIVRKRCFSDCRKMTHLSIGEGITEIDDFAFECCSSLDKLELPNTVTRIGRYAFRGGNSLAQVVIPESVGYIGSGAFENTPLMTENKDDALILGNGILVKWFSQQQDITVPDGVKVIGENAFSSVNCLKRITFSDTVIEVGNLAFENCTELERVRLSENLKIIGDRAFVGCTKLTDIDFPPRIEKIGADALFSTALLDSRTEDTVVFAEKYLLRCTSCAPKYTVPEGVVLIADNSFAGALGIEEVVIPPSVRYIGACAFRWLGTLKRIFIPDSVISIGSDAFMSCNDLNAVVSLKGKQLGNSVFPHWSKLTLVCGDKRFTVTLEDDFSGGSKLAEFATEPSGSAFEQLEYDEYKIPAAVCFNSVFPQCSAYLKHNMERALCYAISIGDMALMNALLDLKAVDASAIDKAIDHSVSCDAVEFRVKLMDKKRTLNNGKSVDSVVDDMFSI